jgi:hypothetical protein
MCMSIVSQPIRPGLVWWLVRGLSTTEDHMACDCESEKTGT